MWRAALSFVLRIMPSDISSLLDKLALPDDEFDF